MISALKAAIAPFLMPVAGFVPWPVLRWLMRD